MLHVVNFAKSQEDKRMHLHGCLTISNLIYVVQVEKLGKFCFFCPVLIKSIKNLTKLITLRQCSL